jgi:hypothetical protein
VRVFKYATSLRYRFLFLVLFLLATLTALIWAPFLRHRVDAKATAAAPPMQVTNPGIVGQWSSLIPFKTVPLHISLLPNGKLLYWGRDKMTNSVTGDVEDISGHSNTYLVDPQFFSNDPLGHTTTYPNSTTNLFCSGHSFLPDGRLLVTGGHDKDPLFPFSEALGDRSVNFFNYLNPTTPWSRHTTGLALGRWYPYNVTLANGNVAIMGGTYWSNRATPSQTPDPDPNPGPERYTYDPQGGQGTLAMYQQDFNPFGPVENYPLVQMGHDGRIVVAGGSNRYFDPNDTTHNPPEGHFINYPFSWGSQSPGQSRFTASSVLYEVAADNSKLMVMGGNQSIGGTPVNQAHTNVTAVEQAWTQVGSMAFKRKFHTATILPDGKVMVSGGSQCPGGNNLTCPEFPNTNSGGAVLSPELWNPANPSVWATMAPAPSGIPRLYHSIALLLPDARVLVGAGGLPGAAGEVADPASNNGRAFGHPDAEIYSPPYLFNLDGTPAQRPTITWLQDDKIGLGQSMLVRTPNYANITQVVLVRLGSVTHGLNQDQRRVVLTFSNNNLSYPETLNVTMPATGKVCPPGPYMMFLLSNGVPSVAKMVSIQVDAQIIDPPPPLPYGATLKSAPAVARNTDGRLQAFYQGGDDALYTISQQTAGSSTWTNPTRVGGAIFEAPVVALGNSGLLEVMVIGGGNVVYYCKQTAPGTDTFTAFTPLSAVSTSGLAINQNADGRLQLVYRGSNNAVWTIAQSAVGSATWSSQISLGGNTTDTPAVGKLRGYMVVYYREADGWLYQTMQSQPNLNTWSYLGQVIQDIASGPTVGNFNGTDQLIVLGRGDKDDLVSVLLSPPDKRMWFPESLGGSMILTAGFGTNADGHAEAFVLGPNQKMYNNYQLKSGWSGFAQLGGSFSVALNTPPVTALNSNGKLSVFVRGSDNSLYMATQNVASGSASYTAYSRITPQP